MRRFGYRHLALALLAGLAGGAALGMHGHRWLERRMHSGDMTPRIVNRLGRELALTDEERQKLTVILTKTHVRLETLHAEARTKFDGALAQSAAEIEKILTPEQAAKFKVLRAKWEARRKAAGPRPDGD
jgi:Spy/CpxP family protein refolding chaperone